MLCDEEVQRPVLRLGRAPPLVGRCQRIAANFYELQFFAKAVVLPLHLLQHDRVALHLQTDVYPELAYIAALELTPEQQREEAAAVGDPFTIISVPVQSLSEQHSYMGFVQGMCGLQGPWRPDEGQAVRDAESLQQLGNGYRELAQQLRSTLHSAAFISIDERELLAGILHSQLKFVFAEAVKDVFAAAAENAQAAAADESK